MQARTTLTTGRAAGSRLAELVAGPCDQDLRGLVLGFSGF